MRILPFVLVLIVGYVIARYFPQIGQSVGLP